MEPIVNGLETEFEADVAFEHIYWVGADHDASAANSEDVRFRVNRDVLVRVAITQVAAHNRYE